MKEGKEWLIAAGGNTSLPSPERNWFRSGRCSDAACRSYAIVLLCYCAIVLLCYCAIVSSVIRNVTLSLVTHLAITLF